MLSATWHRDVPYWILTCFRHKVQRRCSKAQTLHKSAVTFGTQQIQNNYALDWFYQKLDQCYANVHSIQYDLITVFDSQYKANDFNKHVNITAVTEFSNVWQTCNCCTQQLTKLLLERGWFGAFQLQCQHT